MVERCGYAFYGLFALKLVAVVPEELISPRPREYEVSELDWVLSLRIMHSIPSLIILGRIQSSIAIEASSIQFISIRVKLAN
jgi:hypothetical protein